MIDNVDILRQTFRTSDFMSQVDTSATKEVAKGSAMGMEVSMMEDPMQALQDSMEEISGMFEEKSMKEIGQRKLGKDRAKLSPQMEAVQKWMSKLPDMPQAQFLERMIKLLKNAQNQQMSGSELLKLLGRGSNDASHLHAMLDILEKTFGADAKANADILKTIAEAKRQLEAERGAEVRAGLNLADEVNARGKTPDEIRNLRELYRGEVLGFEKPQDCFRSLLAQRGAGRLAESIEFLIRGASIDMQSATPSRSPEELRAIIVDLQSVEVLRTVLDGCDKVVAKMLSEFAETSLLSGEGLCGKIVDLTEMPFTSAADIAQLLQTCGFAQLLAKLYFTTRLTDLFRGLSPRLFSDESDRFRLVDAAQEHLDGLVREQEDAEERAREGKGDAA